MKFRMIIGECSSGDDSDYGNDYMQLVPPGIHSDSEDENDR
jgi:hypothetical protein